MPTAAPIYTVWNEQTGTPAEHLQHRTRLMDRALYRRRKHGIPNSPDGTAEFWQYNEQGNVDRYTNRSCIVFGYAYDDRGNITSETRNGKTVRTIQWNEAGYPVVVREPGLGDKEYTWDKAGFPASRTTYPVASEADQRPITERWNYDGEGRLTSATDGEGRTDRFLYGIRTVTHITSAGLRITQERNNRNDIVRITETDEASGASRTTEIKYDKRHLPVLIRHSDGTTETNEYRPDGELLCTKYVNRTLEYVRRFDGTLEKTVLSIAGEPVTETVYEQTAAGTRIQTFTAGILHRTVVSIGAIFPKIIGPAFPLFW